MNSFKIFPEIVWTNIFTSLKGYDLLEASLVAKDWYRMIARSPICMKKLTIKFRDDNNNLESLLDSNRLYQNFIYYKFNHEITPEHLQTMTAIINKFSGSLTSIQTPHDVEVYSDFPKLKELFFHRNFVGDFRIIKSAIVPNGLLTKSNHLKEFKIDLIFLDSISVNCLRKFLMENESLKILAMRDCRSMRGISSTAIKMRLEEYRIVPRDYIFYEKHTSHFVNIHDFFVSQSSSLKYVQCSFSYDIIQFFIANCPNLQTLVVNTTIPGYNAFGSPFPDYPINTSIKTLVLNTGRYCSTMEIFRIHLTTIISNLQNLEVLRICPLSKEILDVVKCCKCLKQVFYSELWEVEEDDLVKVEKIKFERDNYWSMQL